MAKNFSKVVMFQESPRSQGRTRETLRNGKNVKLEYFDSGIMQIFIFISQALRASDSLEDCPTGNFIFLAEELFYAVNDEGDLFVCQFGVYRQCDRIFRGIVGYGIITVLTV